MAPRSAHPQTQLSSLYKTPNRSTEVTRSALVPYNARKVRGPRPPTAQSTYMQYDAATVPETGILLTSNVHSCNPEGYRLWAWPRVALVDLSRSTSRHIATGTAQTARQPTASEVSSLNEVWRQIQNEGSNVPWTVDELHDLAASQQDSMPSVRFFVNDDVDLSHAETPHRGYLQLPEDASEMSLVHGDGYYLPRTGMRTVHEVSCNNDECATARLLADLPVMPPEVAALKSEVSIDDLPAGPEGFPPLPREVQAMLEKQKAYTRE